MKAISLPAAGDDVRLTSGFVDDFDHEITGRWTSILTDSGTSTCGDAANGIMALACSDGTEGDNDEATIHTAEIFKLLANRPITFGALVQFTEANTDDANILVGFSSGVVANILQDNGAGPLASYTGALFFKADGDTVWSVENSIGTTQKTTQLDADGALNGIAQTAGGASYQLLEIEIVPRDDTYFDVWFKIDNVVVAKHSNQVLASATEMAVVFAGKNGDTNMETLNIDYVRAHQKRGY